MPLRRGTKVGFGLTGSHCTLKEVIPEIESLCRQEAEVFPIVSVSVAETDTRFGRAAELLKNLQRITGREPWRTLAEVEPIGPGKILDIMVVAPCTGTTLARLDLGLSDTPVTLACKAHLRNNRPVVLAVATNDGLGASLYHLASLFNRNLHYFVPFGQDNPEEKPKSLVSRMELIQKTVEYALMGLQIQPVLVDYLMKETT